MFIIAARNTIDNSDIFYGIDHSSGGYPYWARSYNAAKQFDTINEAINVLNKEIGGDWSLYSDGKYFPPVTLHNASGVNFNTPRADVTFSIMKIECVVVETISTITVDLNNPPVEPEINLREQALAKLTPEERKSLGFK